MSSVGVWTRSTRDASLAWPSRPSKQVALLQRQVLALRLGRWHMTLCPPEAYPCACPGAGAAHPLLVTCRVQALSQEAGLGESQSQVWASAGAGPRPPHAPRARLSWVEVSAPECWETVGERAGECTRLVCT